MAIVEGGIAKRTRWSRGLVGTDRAVGCVCTSVIVESNHVNQRCRLVWRKNVEQQRVDEQVVCELKEARQAKEIPRLSNVGGSDHLVGLRTTTSVRGAAAMHDE